MKTITSIEWNKAATGITLTATILLAGCAGLTSVPSTIPIAHAGPALNGSVFGGRQPIAGANIILYAAGATGYASAATNVLSSPVTTDPTGRFNFTNYSCTNGQQMYIVSAGGNPGAGTNANATLMAALGDCANLNSIASVSINEVTTVASAFALSPFSSGYANIGTSTGNAAGLARAFASVNKLVNIQTGLPVGSALPAGAVEPTSEINTLANILAACVNSTGGSSTSNTYCGSLFTAATPPSGTAPSDTIGAAFDIAQNPASNATNLYNIPPPSSPYAPVLAAAPADWTISIQYTGFSAPKSTTIDGSGQVWVANYTANTVTVLAQTGSPIAASPLTGNSLSSPAAIAIDSTGQAWVADAGNNQLSIFNSAGAVVGYTGVAGHLSTPVALAFDAPGNLWIANNAGNTLVEFNSTVGYLAQTSTGISSPTAVAINPK